MCVVVIRQLGSSGCPVSNGAHRVIERGEVTVTIVTALKMAQAFGMTLAGLFTELGDQGHSDG